MKNILKNKNFWIILVCVLFIQLCIYIYKPISNHVKYQYYSYKMENIIREKSQEILTAKLEELEYSKLNEIREIEKKYSLKQTELKDNSEDILEDSIALNKKNLKAQIQNGDVIDLNGAINKISLNYQNNFGEAVETKKKELLVFNNYSYIENDYLKVDVNSLKDIQTINNKENKKEEVIKETEIKENNKLEEKQEKTLVEKQQSQVAKNFEISIQKELPSGIQILDRSKYSNILEYGITFPSFFSYKKNNVQMPASYYDIHYGVDYKTKPAKYINLPFFKNKTGKVYKTLQQEGNTMIITTKNERFEYFHLQQFYKKENDIVNPGDFFAQTGNTGYSTAPHLHFVYLKDGFFVPFDWGLDVNNEKLLIDFGFSKEEAKEFVVQGKDDYINMEEVMGVYKILTGNKDISDIKKIKELFRQYEAKNKMNIREILEDEFFSGRLSSTNLRNEQTAVRRVVDAYHNNKKAAMAAFLKENKKEAYKIVLFDIAKLGSDYKKYEQEDKKKGGLASNSVVVEKNNSIIPSVSAKNDTQNSLQNEKIVEKKKDEIITEKVYKGEKIDIDLGDVCNNYTSSVYNKYNGKIVDQNNMTFIKDKYARENISYLAPIIYEEIKNLGYIEKAEKILGQETNIHECDIVLSELGKWYQEHTFYLDNPKNKAGLFQLLHVNYDNLFPEDKGKEKLSEANYRKQIKDNLEFSLTKMKYKNKKTWEILKNREGIYFDDYVVKYTLWAHHGLVGNDINKNFYTANNLYYSNLPLKDISATRPYAYKDGGFTVGVKIYNNIIKY